MYTLYAYIEQAKYIDIIGFKCKINRQLADGHTEIVARFPNYINNINQPGIGEAILFLFTESGSPLMPYFLFSQFLAKKMRIKKSLLFKGLQGINSAFIFLLAYRIIYNKKEKKNEILNPFFFVEIMAYLFFSVKFSLFFSILLFFLAESVFPFFRKIFSYKSPPQEK